MQSALIKQQLSLKHNNMSCSCSCRCIISHTAVSAFCFLSFLLSDFLTDGSQNASSHHIKTRWNICKFTDCHLAIPLLILYKQAECKGWWAHTGWRLNVVPRPKRSSMRGGNRKCKACSTNIVKFHNKSEKRAKNRVCPNRIPHRGSCLSVVAPV